MNIDTGKVYANDELRKTGFTGDEIAEMIEVHKSDFTEEELEAKQVDLKSNTKAAGHARYFRNMRNFVQGKQRIGK